MSCKVFARDTLMVADIALWKLLLLLNEIDDPLIENVSMHCSHDGLTNEKV